MPGGNQHTINKIRNTRERVPKTDCFRTAYIIVTLRKREMSKDRKNGHLAKSRSNVSREGRGRLVKIKEKGLRASVVYSQGCEYVMFTEQSEERR